MASLFLVAFVAGCSAETEDVRGSSENRGVGATAPSAATLTAPAPTSAMTSTAMTPATTGAAAAAETAPVATPKTAYLTTGHGELNDPAGDTRHGHAINTFHRLLKKLGATVKELPPIGTPGMKLPPGDADLVALVGPTRGFDAAELDALDRYLASGGSMVIALGPDRWVELGPVEKRLGLRFDPTPLRDERNALRLKLATGKRVAVAMATNLLADHPAVGVLHRHARALPIALVHAGSLSPTGAAPHGLETTFIIRSMANSFLDHDADGIFDEETETRGSRNVVAAIEGPGGPSGRGRVLVFADADLFDSALLDGHRINGLLLTECLRWLLE